MKSIRTRFAPSPSGFLHVGGARTALFNWLYARHTGGKFVLRIEDTDRVRSTKESINAIFEGLQWLGIDWDEGPFYQSQRFDIYKEYIEKLVQTGHAYYCTCSPEQIQQMREKAMAAGDKPRYDGTCRDKGLAPQPGAVVRFKAPFSGTTILKDIVKGNIVFQNSELDDFVIRRSDGTPTYNLAVVVDDITMGINTVIRGDDHVMNTPKQILLYQALEADLPVFAHVPMVLGNDRSRLSKRHGATSVTAYRDMGILADALINYLARLGWSHGDQEFFTRQELISKFDIKDVGKSAGIFDPVKLQALNADHIKACNPEQLAHLLVPFLAEAGIETRADQYLAKVISTLNTRSKTLVEMAAAARFYFIEKVNYEEKAARKFLKPAIAPALESLVSKLEKLSQFSEKALEEVFLQTMEETGLKLGKIAQPVRVALTGTSVSPGIFEIIDVLGKERVIARLKQALEFIKTRPQ